MREYVTTKCPKCGQKRTYRVGYLGFFGNETTKCSKCGESYDNTKNSIETKPDVEYLYPTKPKKM